MGLCEFAYYEPNETFYPQLLCHKFDKQDGKQRWMGNVQMHFGILESEDI